MGVRKDERVKVDVIFKVTPGMRAVVGALGGLKPEVGNGTRMNADGD